MLGAHLPDGLSHFILASVNQTSTTPRDKQSPVMLTDLALPSHHHADLLLSGGQEADFLPLRVFCVPQARVEERVRRSEGGVVFCFQDERIVATEVRSSRGQQLQQQFYSGVSASRDSTGEQ